MSQYPHNDSMPLLEFQRAVREGRMVPDGKGGYITHEAAMFTLAALADSRSLNSVHRPPSNVSGAYQYGGPEDDTAGFCTALDRRRRSN